MLLGHRRISHSVDRALSDQNKLLIQISILTKLFLSESCEVQ